MTRRTRTRYFALAGTLALMAGVGCSGTKSDEAPSTPPDPTSAAPFVQEFGGASVDGEPATVVVDGEPSDNEVESNLIGLSFEATDLPDERWDPDTGNLDEVLAELGSPGLRFGGNSLDRRVFWTSEDETAPDDSYTVVTPEDLERVGRMAETLGSDVTLGIPLGDFDPERGADMAVHAVEVFGDNLIGISIGNEPNGFTVDTRPGLKIREDSWNEEEYVEQAGEYIEAIDGAVGEDAPIVGPGAFDGAWLTAFLEADFPGTTALTQHWYATYNCDSTEVPGRGPLPENLVDPVVHDAAAKMLGIGLEKSEAAGLPLWVEETGSTSCSGTTPSSRTHATALWTVDYVLHAAELGVARLNMHSMLGPCDTGATMSVVCSAVGETEGSGDSGGSGEVREQVNHPALELASLSVGGSVLGTEDTGGGNLRSYAVEKDDAIVVTVVNNNDAAESRGNPVSISVPEGYRATEAAQIHGPANDAENSTGFTPLSALTGEGSGVTSSEPGALDIDLVSSSATTVVFEKA
ncbi:hypothetical protein [Brevibacterium samyangense]|uniref:Glycosyl hydrolase family 79, N-terminal domain n=1 Tax=Brevibacterium samyangense TaxID=366888 RepID=A0ABP5F5Y9_9MICO